MSIHPTALIDSRAELADDVVVGPYCVVVGDVKIDSGTVLKNHVTVGTEFGQVELGKNNVIYQGSVVGGPPQDFQYKNEKTKLIMGDNNSVREFATLNLGTKKDRGETRIGNDNLMMAYVHVAHDSIVMDRVVLANLVQLAGHVVVENNAIVGGASAVTQFSRLGQYCYIGGNSTINKDVMPYTIAEGTWAVSRATNKIGLERAGFEAGEIRNIHKAVRNVLKGGHTVSEAVDIIKKECEPSDHIQYLTDFIEKSKKGIAR